VAVGIKFAEGAECGGLKSFGVPFALDGIYLIAIADEDEIHLTPLFVPPITEGQIGLVRLKMFEHQVFPQEAEVVWPQGIPAAGKAHKASKIGEFSFQDRGEVDCSFPTRERIATIQKD
jgi:hypothetical protein